MPLAQPSQQTDLALLEITRQRARHLINDAILANRQTAAILALDDAALTGWLQGHASELETLLTRHAVTGQAINAALSAVVATLTEAGDLLSPDYVDTAPLAEKLAAQGRTLDLATLTVSTPQPVEE